MKKALLIIALIIAVLATIIFPFLIVLWIALAVLMYAYVILRSLAFRLIHGKSEMEAKLEEQNKIHGTKFSTKNLGFGRPFEAFIFFDTENRKICTLSRQGSKVIDFSYITGWQLKWIEVSKNSQLNYKDIHFQFSTTDINTPTIRIGINSMQAGEDWDNRLGIIFGPRPIKGTDLF
jgi:flagellar biosynthesis component FlhA